jgi:2-phosphosulfolactate phosphatase
MVFDQAEFDVRCEWGMHGVAYLAPISDVIIIVDVLSFSTSVDIATGRGALVFPYRWKDETAVAFAASMAAVLAGSKRNTAGYSLSPQSLLRISTGARLVLPSPNGSTLTLATGETPTLAGCLRNARAVAQAAQKYGRRVTVIPAGERWKDDASLRTAFEDLIGAGAILHHLPDNRSPEARLAVAAYRDAHPHLEKLIRQCSSGKELVERGFEKDVALASELNVSTCVPVFLNGAYVRA